MSAKSPNIYQLFFEVEMVIHENVGGLLKPSHEPLSSRQSLYFRIQWEYFAYFVICHTEY